jgi:MFS family permease
MVIGTALAVYPASVLASKKGRKRFFLGAMVLGVLASLLAVYALQGENFVVFVIAAMLVGMVLACVQQFRFAAMESVSADLMPIAASRLLLFCCYYSVTAILKLSMKKAKWVIQSHIMAMFIPSLFSGWLVGKLGFTRMMWIGLGIYIICLSIAYWNQALVHYWGALVLLGLGWNLLFVAGTALLPQIYQANETHHVQGLNDLMVFSAQAIVSLDSGVLLLLLGWQGIMWVALPMIAVQMMLLLNWQRSFNLQLRNGLLE